MEIVAHASTALPWHPWMIIKLPRKPRRVELSASLAMTNYRSGIGGRGALVSPGCGGSCVGAGGGM